MAFRTNKVPAIEERTVSGSSVSFNSAFALPLKACKVSFSATQAGSGDPSPSNPRAISGVSDIGLTANSTPVSISLGDARYGGELDVLTGILTVTYVKQIYNGTQLITLANWRPTSTSVGFAFNPSTYIGTRPESSAVLGNIIANKLTITSYNQIYNGVNDSSISISTDPNYGIFMRLPDPSLTTSSAINQYLSENPIEVVYELAEPTTIQLSANELSSIIGNNTFSTDTGNVDLTYKDLDIAKRGSFREVFKLPS